MIPTWTARARYAYGEYCVRKDSHSMIPTWSTHAAEARKHVRFALGTAIVRSVRYVAHLSATVRVGHHSAPQEPPMTTPQERHEADQDDADRYAQSRAVRRTSHRAHIHELTTEIDRLCAEYDGLRVEWGEAIDAIAERDAEIKRLTTEVERQRVRVNLARLQRDVALATIERAL